ncbi:ACP S-malonyltransferase [Proteiniclasticum ruminis]|uniref:ACP S-malonyltransferase n=1 Tax=Proteiniclasticum ruminis TaxID=398199 RepID=UPI0028AC0FE4|nr:ACP S-malonyltransferase [Proteiniclasticum ruminis]
MAIRFYFPGQGAQYENMGMDFYESFDSYKKLQEEVALVADLPLLEILKDPDALSETENAQLAIFSMSFGIAKLLSEEGIFADEVMGISLGEYAALAYSGAVRQLDTVKMLKKRSYFMSLAAKEKEGFLAAVSFLEESLVEEAVSTTEKVYVSNYNAPNQLVVGGDAQKKEEILSKLKEKGAKKVTFLSVSGAFHTKYMEKAALYYGKYLKNIKFFPPEIPVYANVKGNLYERGDDFRKLLSDHVDHPVRLSSILSSMEKKEEDLHVVLGPGKAMASILKQNKVPGEVVLVSSVEQFKEAVRRVKER